MTPSIANPITGTRDLRVLPLLHGDTWIITSIVNKDVKHGFKSISSSKDDDRDS